MSVWEDRLAAYEPWNEDRASEIIAAEAGKEGAALPILHALQHVFGCVPRDALPLVAQTLNISRAEIHGIATFYHEFRQSPPGRHVLRFCRAEACQSVGAEKVAEELQARLAIGWHDTTPDGEVTLEPVFCLGLCAIGPAAMLDGVPLGKLTADKVAAMLETAS